MTIRDTFTTIEAFDDFVNRLENADKLFEFIAGEIVEVPSNARVSEIAGQILFLIKLFLRQNNLRGHVTGEAGGYQIAGDRYAPDVAYMSVEKQAELEDSGYNSVPPDLAVEVISSDSPREKDMLRVKISNYHADGVTVWVVDPETKTVEVHMPGKRVKIFREKDTVEGGDVLPNLKIPVTEMFDF
ncbi:MAG: Uma2 family endonuclease [Chloroflexota bacterium]